MGKTRPFEVQHASTVAPGAELASVTSNPMLLGVDAGPLDDMCRALFTVTSTPISMSTEIVNSKLFCSPETFDFTQQRTFTLTARKRFHVLPPFH